MPEISVNLATHNRADYLEACLISLCEQTIDPSRYEICVVNNACTDATPQIVAGIATRYPRHKLFMVFEPTPGLARARNRGIAATTAPLIADIDDDATAVADWLERYLLRFAELPKDVGAVGGEINPIWQAPPPTWLAPVMKGVLSAATNLGPAPRYLGPNEGLIECNICYRREALASAGNFPVELGRINTLLLSGEGSVDTVMRSKGWVLFFEPTAIVNHTIHADRLTPQWLRRRMFWQGISDYAMLRYYERCGLKTSKEFSLALPAAPSDWAFFDHDNIDNLKKDMEHLEGLGFVLAKSGIIPTDAA